MAAAIQTIEVKGEALPGRFGHTTVLSTLSITSLVGRQRVLLFGGAIGDTKKYNITNDSFMLDLSACAWKKLVCTGSVPVPRAAHASSTINTLQMVVYGGAAGSLLLRKL